MIGDLGAILVSTGPEMKEGIDRQEGFWDYIRSHGGEWMWEHIKNAHQDLAWLTTGLRDGTVVAVTDGSYD